jgi:hypothetical protein
LRGLAQQGFPRRGAAIRLGQPFLARYQSTPWQSPRAGYEATWLRALSTAAPPPTQPPAPSGPSATPEAPQGAPGGDKEDARASKLEKTIETLKEREREQQDNINYSVLVEEEVKPPPPAPLLKRMGTRVFWSELWVKVFSNLF